jgi:hypothetical protein
MLDDLLPGSRETTPHSCVRVGLITCLISAWDVVDESPILCGMKYVVSKAEVLR